MSVEEFRRLKTAAGEAVPTVALPLRPLILRADDPYPLSTSRTPENEDVGCLNPQDFNGFRWVA